MSVDTLILAEAMASKLQVDRAVTQSVGLQEGFSKVGYRILTGDIEVGDFKFIVLLFRRADLWGTLKLYKQGVADCLQAIRGRNFDAVIILASTLPAPQDDFRVPGRVGPCNNHLSLLAEEASKLEFAKPGKALICSGHVSHVFFEEDGFLNLAGLQLVKYGLENKFRCAQLRNKFVTRAH